jgi:UDP-N-acetylmuramoyl-tripeptide--D-alanyl-D-alanine ligase
MKQRINLWILSYLRFFSHMKIARQHPWIIGVTGSVGKSSFLSLFNAVAKQSYAVSTTMKGNSESGLPLEILGIRSLLHDYGVRSWMNVLLRAPFAALSKSSWNMLIAEMGIDSPEAPKNMEHLLSIVHPSIGVLLNIEPVHTEQFASGLSKEDQTNEDIILKRIASEKGKLVTTLKKEETAIINIDCPYIQNLQSAIKASVITVGSNAKCDIQLTAHSVSVEKGTTFTYVIRGNEYCLTLKDTILFREYGLVIAAVLAAGKAVHIPYEKTLQVIASSIALPAGRFSVFKGKHHSTIFDSSYNASPKAVASALALLQSQTQGKRIAVLGDMRELGPLALKKHTEIVKLAAQSADVIILVGPLMKMYGISVLHDLKFPKDHHHWFLTSKGVGEFVVKKYAAPKDTILVKGSQNTIFLEQVVKELLEQAEDEHKLCRQSAYWDQLRKKFFQENA